MAVTDEPPANGARVAVVTGATRGIGREIANQLAARGLRVVVGGRDAEQAERVAQELGTSAWPASHIQLDVGDPDSVTAAFRAIARDHGRLDVLVNNAGIAIDGPEHRASAPDLDRVLTTLEVNLIGAWRCCAAAIPLMRRRGYGRIVNVSSSMASLAQTTDPASPAYRVSKAGLNMLTRVLAAEVADAGILVNAASPGYTRTDMSPRATRPVEVGADTPVWLATLGEDGPTGGFFYERELLSW